MGFFLNFNLQHEIYIEHLYWVFDDKVGFCWVSWVQSSPGLHSLYWFQTSRNPAGIYLLKVNNRNSRTRCEICSKLTIKTPGRRQWRRSGSFCCLYCLLVNSSAFNGFLSIASVNSELPSYFLGFFINFISFLNNYT